MLRRESWKASSRWDDEATEADGGGTPARANAELATEGEEAMTGRVARGSPRYVPVLGNAKTRGVIGLILVVASVAAEALMFRDGSVAILMLMTFLAWAVSAYLTHKYIHKYPQRYVTYLVASHTKAAVVMAACLAVFGWLIGSAAVPSKVLWTGFGLFVVSDALVSVFRRREAEDRRAHPGDPVSESGEDSLSSATEPQSIIDRAAVLEEVRSRLAGPMADFVERTLPDASGERTGVMILDRPPATGLPAASDPFALVVAQTRLNDVYRLDEYLISCAHSVAMGAYVLVRYAPVEGVPRRLRVRYGRTLFRPARALHFLWSQAIPKIPLLGGLQYLATRKGNRALSKAEVWGRLSYCGMHVVGEADVADERYVLAQRIGEPVSGKRPSYYPIIALEKVGLDGRIVRLHKLRSMFPYSEFLQKRIYEEHGLTSTGKFADDFRITAFGRFVRKYWLDELPQIFDWLRGDVKLVGMRATSPQYLSLYPDEVIDLYVQVKPGLVPPIFDESTNGFARIVEVESAYLKRYCDAPIRTDAAYFLRTCRDIFRRGVRGR